MHHQFSGTLTAANMKAHIPHTFDVPPNARQVHIQLDVSKNTADGLTNMLTLTLFDSAGFRGAGHRGGQSHKVIISREKATPGYATGPLPAGLWTVQIDTHRIVSTEPCHYQLDITISQNSNLDSAGETAAPAPDFSFVANPNPAWYRGDLHSHTIHSDASWDVPDLVAAAREYNLDFITLTDHNTISGLAEMASYATDNFLTMGGQELTTFWGHAVCPGSHQWLDWRVSQTGPEMAAIAAQLQTQGKPFIIAHPKDIGDPYCTGCRWVYPKMMPGNAHFVEVWNESWFGHHPKFQTKNEDGLALWYQWLNEGHRLIATAGSDTHGPDAYPQGPGFNVIYAEALSEQAILAALWTGHLYLSAGPSLSFTAQTEDGRQVIMGDTLAETPEAQAITLTSEWTDCPATANLTLIIDGKPSDTITVSGQGRHIWPISTADGQWCLLELRDPDNRMLALTNPIYFRP